MARMSVSVMAHPDRRNLVPELTDRLGVAPDRVTWDRKNDRWDTGRRAWLDHDPTADYHMVIQDDAVVVENLIPGLERALNYLPGEANVCPFIGRRRPAQPTVHLLMDAAIRANASWIKFPSLFWGVAIIAPTAVIPGMLDFGDAVTEYPNYDKRIGRYFVQVLHWPTYVTWPNLVEHRDVDSLCGHGPGRTAHNFAGEDYSALQFDGSGPVAELPPAQVKRYYRRGRKVPLQGIRGAQ